MSVFRNVAVSISEIRSVGAAGYDDSTLMVPLELAENQYNEAIGANRILVKENTALGKEVEHLRLHNTANNQGRNRQ